MAQNREAMSDLVAILDARRADYARAGAQLDTSGDTVERSFEKLQDIVARYRTGPDLHDRRSPTRAFWISPTCGSNTA